MKVSFEKNKEVRIHTTLSNGQVASFYASFDNVARGQREINVGLCISSKRRDNNDWWNGSKKLDGMSTGKCGMEGLTFALRCMEYIHSEYMGHGDCIVVGAADAKRHSAYRRLCKYGFIDTQDGAYVLLYV